MVKINQILAYPLQSQIVTLADGTAFSLRMRYSSMQLTWFIDNISYGNDFAVKGIRICVSPNILFQWQNLIPFGLACFSRGSREPTQLEDFESGAASLYVLSAAEVIEYQEILNGQVRA